MSEKIFTASITLGALLLCSCSHHTAESVAEQSAFSEQSQTESQWKSQNVPKSKGLKGGARPSVLVYRMRGEYANLVPVRVGENGELFSYPDPIDITSSQAPVALVDGWYLDRRGIGINTAFTDYTYEKYSTMKSVPPVDTLKAHIIDRQGIAEIWDCGKERRSIEQMKKLVSDGFPGCKRIK